MSLLYKNDKLGEYPESWYTATSEPLAPLGRLKGETRADVCVVGGGYTGLSAALHLAQAGLDVVLVEAQRVGFGASGRNGGQVGSGYNMSQRTLERKMGKEAAHHLWDMAEEAKSLTRTLVAQHTPEARYLPGIIHADWHAKEVNHSHREAEYLSKNYGYEDIELLDREGLRSVLGAPAYQGGFIDWGAGHLHPLRFSLGLARAAIKAGVRIFETSPVHNISHGKAVTVRTDRGRVIAENAVLACNGYLGGLDRKVAARVMPINNFIVATEPLGDRAKDILAKDVAVADSKFVVNYFRLSEDDRLLFGGGESYGTRFPRDIVSKVRKPMEQVFPQLKDVRIDYAWGGTLAITASRMPCFLRSAPNVWNASGYSGHGVAMATLAGKIIAQAIQGDTTRFDLLAKAPLPRFPGGPAFAQPILALAMTWYSMRDRMGI